VAGPAFDHGQAFWATLACPKPAGERTVCRSKMILSRPPAKSTASGVAIYRRGFQDRSARRPGTRQDQLPSGGHANRARECEREMFGKMVTDMMPEDVQRASTRMGRARGQCLETTAPAFEEAPQALTDAMECARRLCGWAVDSHRQATSRKFWIPRRCDWDSARMTMPSISE